MKTRFNGCVYNFPFDYKAFDISDITNVHKYLMKNMIWNICLGCIVIASNHTKFVTLSNRKCISHPTHINLQPNEYSQKLRYYHFVANLDRCAGSCNTIDDLSSRAFTKYVQNI